MYKRNTESRSRNHSCRRKQQVLYFLSISVAFVIQHAMIMRRIILSSVASPDVPHFSALSHKRHDFRKKKFVEVKFVF